VNLADRGELTGFLRKHGIQPDKSLGQHFLAAPSVVSRIVEAAEPFEGCLEIGPGPGILTCFLEKRASVMVAIEFDERMPRLLKESAPNCRVIVGDALQVDLSELLQNLPHRRALVSNLPYYITGPLLDRFAKVRSEFDVAVLMMQKEVGEKILAQPSERERGSLSVHLQSQFEISHVVHAPAECFMPPPKVDSVVLKLIPRATSFPLHFSRVVKAGFTQNRKTLVNNLSATFRITKSEVLSLLSTVGLGENSRAFELLESDWVALAEEIEKRPWIESVVSPSKKKR
jgi:16S rRNA (adenine1518-N6/adenine1519-N6)-dimethyltransferase